jgi:hypothetical protein
MKEGGGGGGKARYINNISWSLFHACVEHLQKPLFL